MTATCPVVPTVILVNMFGGLGILAVYPPSLSIRVGLSHQIVAVLMKVPGALTTISIVERENSVYAARASGRSMSEFTTTAVDNLESTCGENLAGIAESLTRNLGDETLLELGETRTFDGDQIPAEFDGPGVIVVIEVGERGIACLIPVEFPLPDWYLTPTDTQSSCLQTVAMEWAFGMLPEDLEAERTETVAVENLKTAILEAEPASDAIIVELRKVSSEEGASDTEADEKTGPRIWVIAPVEKLPVLADSAPVESDSTAASEEQSATTTPAIPDGGTARLSSASQRWSRLLPLSVEVSVRLAEKKIETGFLLKLSPGALIKFNKPCDDLLDLYVNNAHYCRGEAVKIGESFGMKVRDVGVVEPRAERIIQE
jgi:flagellar motor switch protein FliN